MEGGGCFRQAYPGEGVFDHAAWWHDIWQVLVLFGGALTEPEGLAFLRSGRI